MPQDLGPLRGTWSLREREAASATFTPPFPNPMKRILILTASFGDGHNAAARSLREGIELVDPTAKVEVADLFESTYGLLNSLMKQAYQGMVRYTPALWSKVFNALDNPSLVQRQVNSMDKMRQSLAALLE